MITTTAMQSSMHVKQTQPNAAVAQLLRKPARGRATARRAKRDLADQVINAVLPLIDPEDKERLREECGEAEVYAALKPIFTDYTVEDAVLASFAIHERMDEREAPDRFEAMCQARDTLQDFICRGLPSSPACAAARVNFLIEEARRSLIADSNMPVLYETIAHDIECLGRNLFKARPKKRRFGDAKWYAN
jgi:hypothetical protein